MWSFISLGVCSLVHLQVDAHVTSLQSPPVSFHLHISVFVDNLSSVPLPRLSALRPRNILFVPDIALLPLPHLLVRESSCPESIRALLLEALTVTERLNSIAPLVFGIRRRSDVDSRVVGGGEA